MQMEEKTLSLSFVFNYMPLAKVKLLSQATPSSYEYICFVLTFCSQRNAVSEVGQVITF